MNGFKYSDTYKREIRGNDCCGFWRVKNGGVCVGWPHYKEHICPANENGSGCPLFPSDEEKEDMKSLRIGKHLRTLLHEEVSNLERKIYGMTETEQARADIYRQLIHYLNINPLSFIVFNEQMDGNYYSATFISTDSKHCILVSCEDMANPEETAVIIRF